MSENEIPDDYLETIIKQLGGVFTFNEQLKIGEHYERIIDEYISQLGVLPEHVPLHLQREGVDRIFQNGDVRNTTEYKCDMRAGETGNLFLETKVVAADGTELPGWCCKTIAQVVLTLIPSTSLLLWADTWRLKMVLPYWVKQFGLTRWVENVQPDGQRYRACGVAVPIDVYRKRVVFRNEVLKKQTG